MDAGAARKNERSCKGQAVIAGGSRANQDALASRYSGQELKMNNCPHSLISSNPAACSQCLGSPVRRIDVVGGNVTVDGITARPSEPDAMSPALQASALRGSKATGNARRGRR